LAWASSTLFHRQEHRQLTCFGNPPAIFFLLKNDLALEWARPNIPPGSRVFASPFFTGNLRQLLLNISYLPNAASRQYRLPGDRMYNGEIDPIYGAGLLKQVRVAGMSYVVLTSYFNDAFSPSRRI